MSDFVEHVIKPKYTLGVSLVTAGILRRRPDARRFAIGVPSAMLVTEILKLAIDEHRPGAGQSKPEQSFPSGHATATSAYLFSLARTLDRAWLLPVAALAVAAIDASRVRDGAHWPHDVVIGTAIGTAGALLGEWLVRRAVSAARRSRSRRSSAARPA